MMKCINYKVKSSVVLEIFKLFDKDSSGKISLSELEAMLN